MTDDIKNLISCNKLNKLFFSKENVEIIQNAIRKTVFDKSDQKYIIGKQSVRELSIIMRSIYLQYGKNLDSNITQQIKSLNKKVLNYSVPRILSNIKLYMNYKSNLNTLPLPMSHPKNMSNSGSKTLKTFQF